MCIRDRNRPTCYKQAVIPQISWLSTISHFKIELNFNVLMYVNVHWIQYLYLFHLTPDIVKHSRKVIHLHTTIFFSLQSLKIICSHLWSTLFYCTSLNWKIKLINFENRKYSISLSRAQAQIKGTCGFALRCFSFQKRAHYRLAN